MKAIHERLFHVLALTTWVAVLAAGAIAASHVFPTLRALDPTLPSYAASPQSEHWRYAAGEIMDGIFLLADRAQYVVIPVALVTLGVELRRGRIGHRERIRTAALGAASLIFLVYAIAIAPAMTESLDAQRAAARIGDADSAAGHEARFNGLHPWADRTLRTNFVLVLIALGAAAIAPNGHAPSRPSTGSMR